MELKIIYEDENLLVVDKPAGLPVFNEGTIVGKTLADYLLEKFPCLKDNEPPRYGIAHRLDKNTSGIVLVAKNKEFLIFFQQQFKERTVEKKYLALVTGNLKNSSGIIETLISRSPKDRLKQMAYPLSGGNGLRKAITKYETIKDYDGYSLLEVAPKTGRKHQIRCHLAYIHHPLAGDKVYGFKGQLCPKGLARHFLHASYLKINLPDGKNCEFYSELPEDLKKILKTLE